MVGISAKEKGVLPAYMSTAVQGKFGSAVQSS